MFTGIVQNCTALKIEQTLDQFKSFSISLTERQADNLQTGASIALNGVCLTVTRIEQGRAYFDVMMETLRATNLGQLDDGALVNVERAARMGDDIGGHLMSGHVASTAALIAIYRPANNWILWFAVSPQQRRYLFSKGFVGLNGCSLTIGEVQADRFNVYLIPETLAVTTFDQAQVGTLINLEFDAHTQAIVDTLERMKGEGAL